jgi:hypothetical protein
VAVVAFTIQPQALDIHYIAVRGRSLPVDDILVELTGYADEEILVTHWYSNPSFSVVEPVDKLPEDMHLLLYVDRQLSSYTRRFTVRIFSTC